MNRLRKRRFLFCKSFLKKIQDFQICIPLIWLKQINFRGFYKSYKKMKPCHTSERSNNCFMLSFKLSNF